ncbi:MAG: 4-hydroxy-tetrahydrodipicolinate reductase [Cyclobacteriaceae bacterium]
MNIALIGYGKMGKAIEAIAKARGNNISAIIDFNNQEELEKLSPETTDVAIEFTQPTTAFNNLKACMEQGIPVVSGTTGWLDQKPTLEKICQENKGAFFYASNYSIGVNLFFSINQKLAQLMNPFNEYQITMDEIHHIHKKDEPSGTAITLAEGIIDHVSRKNTWEMNNAEGDKIGISSFREGEVPGTHVIKYQSEIDTIEIKHEAHSRQGFATGAVVAAEWLAGKQGVFGMNDMLNL